MKNKTSSLLLWLAAMMLTACSPSKEDKTKENGASAASSTASAASSSAPQTDLQPAASAPDNVKQAESVPPSNCTDLHPPPALTISCSKSPNTLTRTVCLPFPITNWKPVSAYPAAAMTTYSGCCFPTSALKIPTTIRKSYWQLKTCVTESARSAGRHKMP